MLTDTCTLRKKSELHRSIAPRTFTKEQLATIIDLVVQTLPKILGFPFPIWLLVKLKDCQAVLSFLLYESKTEKSKYTAPDGKVSLFENDPSFSEPEQTEEQSQQMISYTVVRKKQKKK